MKYIKDFVFAVLAGLCIGIGGTAFLCIDNKIVGAMFFTVGLFIIVTNGFNLFTGKVCYVFNNKPSYLITLLIIYVGNLCGAVGCGLLVRSTRIAAAVIDKANGMCTTKLDDSLISVFILAAFCNILIYIAVDGYKNNPHGAGKYIALFLGVAGFILCSFEHCVANMYYFTVAGIWGGRAILYLFIMTLGNAVGGILFPLCKLLNRDKE